MIGDSVDFVISPELRSGLEKLGRDHGASLFMVTHAALTTLLARLSNSDDITIGTPHAARTDQMLDDLVGMFVNTLVLRARVDAGDSFAALIERIRDNDLAAFGHSDVPFEKLVEALHIRRSASYSPLFQVMLAFQNNRLESLELPGLTVRVIEDMAEGAKYDLTLTMSEKADDEGRPSGLGGRFTFATDLFERESVERITQRFVRILEAVVENSTRRRRRYRHSHRTRESKVEPSTTCPHDDGPRTTAAAGSRGGRRARRRSRRTRRHAGDVPGIR